MSWVKHLIKQILYLIDNLFIKAFGGVVLKQKNIKYAHFSIDDVHEVIKPNNTYILDSLKYMHDKYGLIVHNYLFYKVNDNIALNEASCIYKQLDWMDWGAHQAEYIKETYSFINQWGLQKSKYIRLHEFKATILTYYEMTKEGVAGLLTADSNNRLSYNLNKKQLRRLNNDGFVKANVGGGIYLKTDFRLERVIFPKLLLRRYRGGTLVFFTHENKYKIVEKRLNMVCRLLHNNGIIFV